MTRLVINIGSEPNDGTGDQLRAAFDKTNINFAAVISEIENEISVREQAVADLSTRIDQAVISAAGASITSANFTSAVGALQNAVSAVSVAVVNEISNRNSAINATSVALNNNISALSTKVKDYSAKFVSVNNGLVTASIDVVSIRGELTSVYAVISNTISNQASIRAAADAALSSRIDGILIDGGVSVTSAELQNEASIRAADDAALSGRIDNIVVSVPPASVTSAQLASVDTKLSNAISAVSAQLTSVNNNLQSGIDVISNRVSALSSQVTSADNAISAAVNVVSNALSNELSVRAAADAALSSRIDNIVVSVPPASITSAQLASVDTKLSNAISAVSAQLTSVNNNLLSGIDVISNRVSAVSSQLTSANDVLNQAISVISQQVSALSARVATNSADVTSIDSKLSNAISAVSASLSLEISARTAGDASLSTRIDNLLISANFAMLSNNVSVDATHYILAANAVSGPLSNVFVADSKLYFNPSTGTLNATTFNSLSDETLKVNIKEITDSIELIKMITPVSFNWKDSGIKSYGTIAQELEKVLPELIYTNDQGVKSVSYIPIIAMLVAAIKTHHIEIERLRELVIQLLNGKQ
jgi:hypothetical protein